MSRQTPPSFPASAAPPEVGEQLSRQLVTRMRELIDTRYGTAEARASAWASFQAMAGFWATDEGLRHPDAYQALAPIVDRLRELIPRRNPTLAGIQAIKRIA